MRYNNMLIINGSQSEVLLGVFLIITLFVIIYTIVTGILTLKRMRLLKEAKRCAVTGLTIRKSRNSISITEDNEDIKKAGEADRDYDFF